MPAQAVAPPLNLGGPGGTALIHHLLTHSEPKRTSTWVRPTHSSRAIVSSGAVYTGVKPWTARLLRLRTWGCRNLGDVRPGPQQARVNTCAGLARGAAATQVGRRLCERYRR